MKIRWQWNLNTAKRQKDKGFYSKDDFTYVDEKNYYICPKRDKCISNKTASKTITRTNLVNMIESHLQDMKTDKAKKLIKKRGSIVEHPFGTIKQSLGWSYFLVRGYEKIEVS